MTGLEDSGWEYSRLYASAYQPGEPGRLDRVSSKGGPPDSADCQMPAIEKIDEPTAFLPRLYAEDFSPVKEWKGGERTESGAITMPWPDYDQVVRDFFKAASAPCWRDGGYLQSEAVDSIGDEEFVENASLDEIRSMLTWCVRGERFCDGHWAGVIDAGHIRRLLERLIQIRAEMD